MEYQNQNLDEQDLDHDGFMQDSTGWSRDVAEELAERNDLGPLTEDHWKIIDYVRAYFKENGEGPPVVKIGRALDMSPRLICKLFPCGVAKGAYRLAGLPRPFGCL